LKKQYLFFNFLKKLLAFFLPMGYDEENYHKGSAFYEVDLFGNRRRRGLARVVLPLRILQEGLGKRGQEPPHPLSGYGK
jgi:hypothetical protein